MKILLYNWVNYDDEEKRGGGVRVYHENLIGELTKDPEVQVYTLSSGIKYDLFDRRVRVRERSISRQVRNFEVVNSPVAAPAHFAFYSLDVYLENGLLQDVVGSFIETHGPFDVVQFDNLEGLTAGVLELKRRFPETRFLYYMHNYNLICPQVNLWFAETENCDDYNEGKRCASCLERHIDMREVKIAHAVSAHLKSAGIKPGSFLFRAAYSGMAFAKRILAFFRRFGLRLRPPASLGNGTAGVEAAVNTLYSSRDQGQVFRQYRERNMACVNEHFDAVLAVSERVREIAVALGVAENKARVVYIGTRFAAMQAPIQVKGGDCLKIAYLGYERRDKGFYHLVETLETMPRSVARRVSVLIGARVHPSTLERLRLLAVEFACFDVVDGYTHGNLAKLLDDVDLGIVPVLWEDNLPQVAIEFVAHGVPVLSSDLGGAGELCGRNSLFVYRHGDSHDLVEKIRYFLDHREALVRYADGGMELVDMQRHLGAMMEEHYRSQPAPSPELQGGHVFAPGAASK